MLCSFWRGMFVLFLILSDVKISKDLTLFGITTKISGLLPLSNK